MKTIELYNKNYPILKKKYKNLKKKINRNLPYLQFPVLDLV